MPDATAPDVDEDVEKARMIRDLANQLDPGDYENRSTMHIIDKLQTVSEDAFVQLEMEQENRSEDSV